MKSKRLSAMGLSAGMLLACVAVAAQDTRPGSGPLAQTQFDAHTEPSRQSKAAFPQPGVVSEVLVKDGDTVKAGQLLVRLDDRGEVRALESMEIEAKSTFKVDAAKADLEAKRVELARKQDLFSHEAVGPSELDDARVQVKIREIQVGLEGETLVTKGKDAARQAVRVEQMAIRAPFDGLIQKCDFEVGEIPDQQKAIVIVRNDVVWINVYMPTSTAIRLKTGQDVPVKYKDTGEETVGKVIFLSPVADAASETRLVRLEVANPASLPSGLAVSVTVPSTVHVTAKAGEIMGAVTTTTSPTPVPTAVPMAGVTAGLTAGAAR